MITSVSDKGQVVIPARIRRKLKLKKRTKLYVEEKGDKIILMPLTSEYIDNLAGILKTDGKLVKALAQQRQLDKQSD